MMFATLALLTASKIAGQGTPGMGGAVLWPFLPIALFAHPASLGAANHGDTWGFHLSVLALLVGLLVIYAQVPPSPTLFSSTALSMALFLITSLLAVFAASHTLYFYMFFESSALCIFFLILGGGYQPERLPASLYLLLFTLGASLPFLLVLLDLYASFGLSSFWAASAEHARGGGGTLYLLFLAGGFLVKFPMYFFHIWLPKAHVEASAGGSMVLAGLLLKLGAYGLFRTLSLLPHTPAADYISGFALLGGLIISALCVRASDMKVLIAYSSVAHMALLICALLNASSAGSGGALGMSLGHGLASSGLFLGAGLMYNSSGSRLSSLNSGQLSWFPSFTGAWFLLCAANMGTPPSLNFWSEVLLIFSLAGSNLLALLPLGLMLFLAVVFSSLLYLGPQCLPAGASPAHPMVVPPKDLAIMLAHLALLGLYTLSLSTF